MRHFRPVEIQYIAFIIPGEENNYRVTLNSWQLL